MTFRVVMLAAALTFAVPAFAKPVIGQPAPNFSVTDASGKTQSLSAYKGKIVVLEWNNPECPFVRKHYGAHNMHENRPGPAFRSDTLIFGTYFNGGVRVHDISDPFQPKEVAYFVPEAPKGNPSGAIQINDVYVDENEIVYAADRFSGGLYVLEADL